MKSFIPVILFASIFSMILLPFALGRRRNNHAHGSIQKNLSLPSYTYFDINNISTRISDDGTCDNNLNPNLEGLIYPKGSKKHTIYASGLLWGGEVNGDIRIGGSDYISALQPGKINQDRTAQNLQDPSVRIYRVRRDYATADLTSEVNDGEGTAAQIKAQYQKDWNEWPAADGAPYQDVNCDGKYEPNIDIPGVPGADQTIFYIANDLNDGLVSRFHGTSNVGLELHVTVWGYKKPSPFDNMIFKKYQLINKSSQNFTNAYFGIWCDTDIGDANDDVNGCDTLLNLGYTYNFNRVDQVYGISPPAVGFTLLQGPVVNGASSDSAVVDGRVLYGEKNLPMTSLMSYTNTGIPGNQEPTPPVYIYNLLQGKLGNGQYVQVPPQIGGGTTIYPYSGDPVTSTGFLDANPSDKRIMINSGPFNLALGDTQEVVFAEILSGGFGSVDNLKAVSLLKNFTEYARYFYKDNFLIPGQISPPDVSATGLDKEIILSWGNNIDSVNQTENFISGGSRFEGYNVYQLPSDTSSIAEGTRIATSDLADGITSIVGKFIDSESGDFLSYVEQYGTDSGIQRFLDIKTDTLTGRRFNDGSKYYFTVTAYTYNPSPEFFNHSAESLPKIITVVPQSNNPGVRYEGTYGEQINVTHTSGLSEGNVKVMVVDPTRLTGDTYSITFSEEGNQLAWNLIDSTTGKVKLQNQTGQPGTSPKLLADGMQLYVNNSVNEGVKDFIVSKGQNKFDNEHSGGFNFQGFWGTVGWASPASVFGNGQKGVTASKLKNVLLVLAKVTDTSRYNPYFNLNDTNMSFGYRYGINFDKAAAQTSFTQFILNKDTGFAYQDFEKDVPLSAWDVDDPLHPRRLAVGFTENNVANGLVDGKYWPPPGYGASPYNNTALDGPREWLWIFNTDYTTIPDPQFEVEAKSNPLPIMYFLTVNRLLGTMFSPDITGEDQLLIEPYHLNSVNDVFTFRAPAVTSSIQTAREDINKINVFPNPYYGNNPQSENQYQKFVTFSHLPQKAVIRIFNLAGTEVAEISKDNPDQFQRWYLYNDAGIPLASGLYIAYIEMPELGVTKILKVAVIQSNVIPERF